MARLLALSALAVAASSAVGPLAGRTAGAASADAPSHATAELHGAVDADDARCAGPTRLAPISHALPVALPAVAPVRALGRAPAAAVRALAAPVAVHRFAPKTSPPARLLVTPVS